MAVLAPAIRAQAAAAPLIQWLVATPASIAGGGSTTLRWHVDGADTLSIDQGVGAVAAKGSITISPAVTTTYTLTATNTNGSATKSHIVVVSANPTVSGQRFVNMVSPVGGQRFTAPATLRTFAVAFDPDGVNCGVGATGDRCASRVDFYVDNTLMASVPGSQSEYWVFKATFGGVGAGVHRVWARAIYNTAPMALDSEPMWITVDPAPAYAQTINLTQDVVLSGAQNYEFTGTAGGRIRINGNGHRITSSGNWTGRLTFKYVDLFNLGVLNDTTPALDVDTSNAVAIEDSVIDTSGTLSLFLRGTAAASIRRNDFRSNMLMQEAQQPEFGADASYPALMLSGSSTAQKFFQGNTVGIGWVDIRNADNWLIGAANGGGSAEGNVVIAPRGGIWVRNTTRTAVRGNHIYHVYYGGWSQGNVMELDDSNDLLVEHNIIGGGSWPIRGFGGTLRYNLVIDAGHQWLWITGSNASVHHNVFAGGDGDVAAIWTIYNPLNVKVFNNTIDGLGRSGFRPLQIGDLSTVALRSNAVVNTPDPPAVQINGTLDADYNLFAGQQGAAKNYSDNRHPPHDAGALNAQVNPKFLEPSEPWRYDWADLWSRRIGVGQVLANYRTRYTPGSGSPLIDAGDNATVAGNDIGAVGSGLAAVDDLFGRFETPPPADSTPPTGTIQINAGAASTSQSAVTLTLTATDNASGVAEMRFSNDGVTFGAPIAFAATASWVLTNGDGNKTVYAQFRDGAGNWSVAFSDSIVLAAAGPLVFTGIAHSRKTHGAQGVFNLPLNAADINGAIVVEPRAIGSGHVIAFRFSAAVNAIGSVSVVDALGMPAGSFSVVPAGDEALVTVSGLGDNRRITVSVGSVNGAGGPGASVSIAFVAGDVTGSYRVTAADLSAIKARRGALLTNAGNYRFDLNASGAIDDADLAIAKARSGRPAI